MAVPIAEPLAALQLNDGEENVPSEEELQRRFDAMADSSSGKASILKWMFNWDPKLLPFRAKWLIVEDYRRMAEEKVATSWSMLQSDGWYLEKRGGVKGDMVESKTTKEFGKVFRFTGVIDCPAKWFFEDLRDNFVHMSEWNPTIIKAQTIKKLEDGLDLVYQITAGGGKGIVSTRDFVLLRKLCALDASGHVLDDKEPDPEAYTVCGVSAEVPGYPPVKEHVRGVTKIGTWIMRPSVQKTSSGETVDKCIFQWLFGCDLKGKMPAFVIDAAFSTVMLNNVEFIRKRVAEAKSKNLF